ncbi:MAG: bifunctional heptose 7-phosphate kinase/heptose 1-phosphate adenyltransferase [Anaerolineae bacterium]
MDNRRLAEIMEGLNRTRILVIGDYFLDKYMEIDASLGEPSLETGLVAHQVTGIRTSPGAAGNVAANVRALGPQVSALTVIGQDGEGYELGQRLAEMQIDVRAVIASHERFTPTYTKPMMREVDGNVHEMSRFDIKNRNPLHSDIEEAVIAHLREIVPQVQGVIIADQVPERNCGVITDRIRQALTTLASEQRGVIFIADSRLRIGEYRNILLKPNEREAYHALGWQAQEAINLAEAENAGRQLASRTGGAVMLTVGAQGILLCSGTDCQHIAAVPVRGPIDIVGAGDSAIAGIASALCCGASLAEAALFGNLVAAVTIRCIGTTGTANQSQVRAALAEWQAAR